MSGPASEVDTGEGYRGLARSKVCFFEWRKRVSHAASHLSLRDHGQQPLGAEQVITPNHPPGSFSDEVERFIESAAKATSADLRASAPRFDHRLRVLDRERNAIMTALFELPLGRRKIASRLLGRIRSLVKADNKVVFDCYWHDLGGEGGA